MFTPAHLVIGSHAYLDFIVYFKPVLVLQLLHLNVTVELTRVFATDVSSTKLAVGTGLADLREEASLVLEKDLVRADW